MMISNERNPRFREDERTIDSNWSELPSELLGEILGRLNFIDAARVKCVCSHWSSVSVSPSDNPTTPWLLIPPRGGDIYRIGKGFSHLYNPADGHLHRTKTLLDEFRSLSPSHLLIGSSHGFLIGLTKYDHDLSVVPFVSNPLTGTRIGLPRIDHLMKFEWYGTKKAILTSAPVGSRSGGAAALVLLYGHNKLAACCTCTPRDDDDDSNSSSYSSSSWTELDVKIGFPGDVSSAGGKIFAVGFSFSPFSVEIWSSNPPFEKITVVNPVLRFRQATVFCSYRYYIVMPLLVVRLLAVENEKTVWFEVYRMDDGKENWVKAESLGENRALFLGCGGGSHSVSVSPAAAGGGVEADCIYYTADNLYGWQQDGPDVGVFSLREGRIIKELTGGEFGVGMNNEWEFQPPLRWLVPTP